MESGGRFNPQQMHNEARAPRSDSLSLVVGEGGAAAAGGGADGEKVEPGFMRKPDEYMPIANIMRIMRRVLPPQAKVADDAKETIQECLTEFMAYITAEANAKCHSECRKTVTPEDIISAMAALGLDSYVEPLTLFLRNHRAQNSHSGSRGGGGGGSGSGSGGGEGSSAGADLGRSMPFK